MNQHHHAAATTSSTRPRTLFERERNLVGSLLPIESRRSIELSGQDHVLGFSGAEWKDLIKDFPHKIDLSGALLRLTVTVDASKTIPLRIAFLTRSSEADELDSNIVETWKYFPPGVSEFNFRRGELGVHRGNPNMSEVERIVFGGQPDCPAKVGVRLFALRKQCFVDLLAR